MTYVPSQNPPRWNASAWFLFSIILIVLVACRWHVLSMPLYEDQSVGFGREADYLSATDFDYHRLRYEEPHFLKGGTARSYMISVIPTTLATLYRVTGSTSATLWLWHLLSMVMAALVTMLVFIILRGVIGSGRALLSSLCLLSTPMFLAQADLAGMEIPLCTFALLATLLFLQGRFVLAMLFSTMAFLMKASGTLVSVALWLVALVRGLWDPTSRRAAAWQGIIIGLFLIGLQVAAVLWGDDTAKFRTEFPWPKAFRPPIAFLWCPDLALLTLFSAVAAVAALARSGQPPTQTVKSLVRRLATGDVAVTSSTIAALVIGASFASMYTYIFIPRYYILPLVFVYLILPILLAARKTSSLAGVPLLLMILIVNIINHRGLLYPSVESVAGKELALSAVFPPRSCGFTERSLEYLDDHVGVIEAIRKLETEHADASILLDMPHWIYLTTPFVGYVKDPPPHAVRAESYLTAIRKFRDRALDLPRDQDLLYLWTSKASVRLPNLHNDVETLHRDAMNPPVAILKTPRSSLPNSPRELEDWYLDHTWSAEFALHRFLERYEFLKRTGRLRRAFEELHVAKWLFPNVQQTLMADVLPQIELDLMAATAQSQTIDGTTWMLEKGTQASAAIRAVPSGVAIDVQRASADDGGLVVLRGPRLFVRKGDRIDVEFMVKSSRDATLSATLQRLFEPPKEFVPAREIQATSEATRVKVDWVAPDDEPDASLVFVLSESGVTFDISGMTMTAAPPQ